MRKEHGREKKGISMLPSVCSPLCSLVAKSGTELLPPRFSASTSFCFPLPLPLLVFLSPFSPFSFHLSCFFTHHFQLCDPAFPLSTISPPHSSYTFPLIYFHPPFFLCLIVPSLHLSLPLSNPVFNSLTLPPFFLSLCQLSLYLSLLSSLLFLPQSL